MSDRRFQVFVSSTYTDLVEERRLVTEQLLRARCIPAGMELFTASGMAPWEVIKAALDTTDYVVLILAGRYGSTLGEDGISYTEREYDYAVSLGIPVLAFLHAAPGRIASDNVDIGRNKKKLDAFIKKVRDSGRHTIETWIDADDLTSKVSIAVIRETLTQPRPGWVRGDAPPPAPASPANQDAEKVSDVLNTPGGAHRAERLIEKAVSDLKEVPVLSHTVEVNAVGNVSEEHAARLAAILSASEELVDMMATVGREAGEDLDRAIIDTIVDLSDVPLRGGYSALIQLQQAPAVLAFHAAGLGACANRKDALTGLLLSDRYQVVSLGSGERHPLVSSLTAGNVWPTSSWSSKNLFGYLSSTLRKSAWSEQGLLRAWERWQFLASTAGTFYRESLRAPSPAWPYLRLDAGYGHDSGTVVASQLFREMEQGGLLSVLTAQGFCSGNAEKASAAANEFERRYETWGNEQDWGRVGFGTSNTNRPHYPGGE